MHHQRETKSEETLFDSDGECELSGSNSDLFNLEIKGNFYQDDLRATCKTPTNRNVLKKLQVVQLDFISIPASITQSQHIVNLRQSFTFPASFKPSKEISTQTSQINLMTGLDKKSLQRPMKRPVSLPPENIALTNLQNRFEADIKLENLEQIIGDGVENKAEPKTNEIMLNGFRKPDLELADCIPPMGVQCILMKPK